MKALLVITIKRTEVGWYGSNLRNMKKVMLSKRNDSRLYRVGLVVVVVLYKLILYKLRGQ